MSRNRHAPVRALVTVVALLALVCAGVGGYALLRHGSVSALGRGFAPFEPGESDGYIDSAHPVSSFDDEVPAIANLDPALRSAVQQAQRDAEADGFTFVITSGWRSHAYQQWLMDETIRTDGEEAARQRVAEPGTSAHESGKAVDIGYTDADSWMMQHGSAYGLCQIYTNEMWHYELATTPRGECPAQLSGAEAR